MCDFIEEGKRCITSRQDVKLSVGRGRKIEREGKEGASMSKTEGDPMPYSKFLSETLMDTSGLECFQKYMLSKKAFVDKL